VLDIGWTEILVITVIALFVVGPKDIPKALKTVGIWVGKLKSLSREFQNTVEDAVRDSELDEVKKQIESAKTDFTKGMTETIDSEGELTEMLRGVLEIEEKDKKTIGAKLTLKNIDLDIKEGEFVCVIGETGCGKTSLLQAIIGDMIAVSDD
jgi:Tat protein translocase TatB subunit